MMRVLTMLTHRCLCCCVSAQVMMVLGTLVFPTQAVLCYRMLPMSHMKAKVYHFVSHILGGMCMAIGLTSVTVYHMRKRLPHFRSLHAWMGLGTLGLYALQFVIGFLGYCWPKLPFGPRKSSLPTHQFVGCCCFAFSCVTVALGVNSKIDSLVAYADPITKKAVDSFGPEVQLAQWIAVGAIVLMASSLYVILGGQKRTTRSERGSAEEIESLRRRQNDDDIYEHDL